jgi:integrase
MSVTTHSVFKTDAKSARNTVHQWRTPAEVRRCLTSPELGSRAGVRRHSGVATRQVAVALVRAAVWSKLVWGKPKSKAGERVVGLDKDSVKAGTEHRSRRRRERLAAGIAWEDSGRMFTAETGAPLKPDWISRRFKELTAEAGLPVIKFHAARHTAATLALQAKVETKIVNEQLGHSTTRITEGLYQHVSVQMQIGAAETVVALLPQRKAKKTGL